MGSGDWKRGLGRPRPTGGEALGRPKTGADFCPGVVSVWPEGEGGLADSSQVIEIRTGLRLRAARIGGAPRVGKDRSVLEFSNFIMPSCARLRSRGFHY